MTYSVAPEDFASITDVEMVFGTERLLPAMSDIPPDFLRGNPYTELARAICFDQDLPDREIEIKDGFDPASFNRAVRAHLQSRSPRHEHKIAGVGLMIAQVAVFV